MNGKYIQIGILILSMILITGCSKPTTASPTGTVTQPTITGTNPSSTQGYPAPVGSIATSYPISITPQNIGTNIINPTTTPDPRISPLIIQKVTHQGDTEVITLMNISGLDQDLRLYSLVDPASQQFKEFNESFILKTGATYDIYNGSHPNNLSANQIWLAKPVLINQYDEIYLLNQAAAIIWTYIYLPPLK